MIPWHIIWLVSSFFSIFLYSNKITQYFPFLPYYVKDQHRLAIHIRINIPHNSNHLTQTLTQLSHPRVSTNPNYLSQLHPTRFHRLSTSLSAHTHRPWAFLASPRVLPTRAISKINPEQRRDADNLSLRFVLLLQFLAVTTLVATLCRRRQGSFRRLLFSWPWRTSQRGLWQRLSASRPSSTTRKASWNAESSMKSYRLDKATLASTFNVFPCSDGTSDDVFRLTGSFVRRCRDWRFHPTRL